MKESHTTSPVEREQEDKCELKKQALFIKQIFWSDVQYLTWRGK